MIILMRLDATKEQIDQVCDVIRQSSVEPLVLPGEDRVAIGIPAALTSEQAELSITESRPNPSSATEPASAAAAIPIVPSAVIYTTLNHESALARRIRRSRCSASAPRGTVARAPGRATSRTGALTPASWHGAGRRYFLPSSGATACRQNTPSSRHVTNRHDDQPALHPWPHEHG